MAEKIKDLSGLLLAVEGSHLAFDSLLSMAAELQEAADGPLTIEPTAEGRKELGRLFTRSRKRITLENPYVGRSTQKARVGKKTDREMPLHPRPIGYRKLSQLLAVFGIGISTDSLNKLGRGDHVNDETLFKVIGAGIILHPTEKRAITMDEAIAILRQELTIRDMVGSKASDETRKVIPSKRRRSSS